MSRATSTLIVTAAVFLAMSGGLYAQQANMTFFVTSAGPGKGADLGGLTGADQLCLRLAQSAGAGNHTWHAYLSTQTADGQTAVLAITSDREWRRLTRDLLGRPELADDPRYAHNADRVRHRTELDQLVGTWCAGLDLAEIQRRADDAGIGNARLNGVSDLAGHPQLAARLIGAAAAARDRTGLTPWPAVSEAERRTAERAQALLPGGEYAAEVASGRSQTIEDALAQALQTLAGQAPAATSDT